MPSTCQEPSWTCPQCNEENTKYISAVTILRCTKCKSQLSWNGEKVVTYEEWLKR